ncbi:hypothetical protein BDN72DRAFT_900441 [Pluteus cervinus]|uniref:Uncharacterized protein n=1 Tax=Pluteus cervinus TaxID=181527 RepID=A0ACD3AK52_9AGAR|nr:hypothetical protein BDN72DRAFT_900441 [Pluteus cervinus]
MPNPHFPPELEQEIFVYAVQNRIQDATNLFLVAKRVQEWLLPVVFKVVIVYDKRLFPIRFNDLSQFKSYGRYIEHLLLSSDFQTDHRPQILQQSLAQCPNITNLALTWFRPQIPLESLTSLSHLTCLCIAADYLVCRIADIHQDVRNINEIAVALTHSCTSITSSPALFPKITHLEAFGARWRRQHGDLFLTMLAYHFPGVTHISHNQTPFVELTLQKFKELKALVWWDSFGDELKVVEDSERHIHDERIVPLVRDWAGDWEREARGRGMGVWSFADNILEGRRKAREELK